MRAIRGMLSGAAARLIKIWDNWLGVIYTLIMRQRVESSECSQYDLTLSIISQLWDQGYRPVWNMIIYSLMSRWPFCRKQIINTFSPSCLTCGRINLYKRLKTRSLCSLCKLFKLLKALLNLRRFWIVSWISLVATVTQVHHILINTVRNISL